MSDTRTARPETIRPWLKWACVGTYWFVTAVLLLGGVTAADVEALALGIALTMIGIVWSYYGTQAISRAIERTVEGIGTAIGFTIVAAIEVGIPLVGLYFLVRFIKWAWTND